MALRPQRKNKVFSFRCSQSIDLWRAHVFGLSLHFSLKFMMTLAGGVQLSGVSIQRNARKKVRNKRNERNSRKNRKLQPTDDLFPAELVFKV